MSDNVTLNPGVGGSTISSDELAGGIQVQRVKIQIGDDGYASDVFVGNPLPINDAGGSITVDATSLPLPTGAATESTLSTLSDKIAAAKTADFDSSGGTDTVAMIGIALPKSGGAVAGGTSSDPLRVDPTGSTTQPVSNTTLSVTGSGTESGALRVTVATDSTGVLSVDDNGSSLTIDNAALSVTGGGAESGALRVTIATDSTGVLSVDDNGGSLTVDGTVTANAGTGDFTVTQSTASNLNATVLGTTAAGSGASSGLVTVQGHASGTAIPVSGTVTANIGTSGSLALDATIAKLTVAQSTALGSNTQAMVGGAVTTSAPTYTTGNINPLSLTTAGALRTDSSGVTQPVAGVAAHDAASSGNPVLGAGYASAAAPSDVSADGDVVRAWHLRNGASATVITAAGALVGGDATNGLDVDVTRLAGSDVANDAADSGNPHKIGYRAATSFPTAVSGGDRVNAAADVFGRALIAHIDPGMFVSKSFNATTAQTGATIWAPTSGKKIAVTSVTVGSYGTTAARLILWFGDNADTTFTEGTDQVLLKASFAPSSSVKPGLAQSYMHPIYCTTADRELHITTDDNLSVDVVVHGYEF